MRLVLRLNNKKNSFLLLILGQKSRSFLLSVLGISVTVGYRVDGIVPPEEKSAEERNQDVFRAGVQQLL